MTERGRERRRRVRVDLGEVRQGLGLPNPDDCASWEQVRALLLDAVGESTFAIWLEPLELIAIDGDRALVVAAPSQTASWVHERFGRLMARCAQRVGRELRLADEPERVALGRQSLCNDHTRTAATEIPRQPGQPLKTSVAERLLPGLLSAVSPVLLRPTTATVPPVLGAGP